MVCRRAGFQPNQAGRNPSKEREDLASSQPLTHHHIARLVDRMNLENVLCEIKTNCCNIAHGWLPLLVIFDDHHFGTSMPSGGHPPHQLAASFISDARTLTLALNRVPAGCSETPQLAASFVSDAPGIDTRAQSSRLAEFGGRGMSFNICRGTCAKVCWRDSQARPTQKISTLRRRNRCRAIPAKSCRLFPLLGPQIGK